MLMLLQVVMVSSLNLPALKRWNGGLFLLLQKNLMLFGLSWMIYQICICLDLCGFLSYHTEGEVI